MMRQRTTSDDCPECSTGSEGGVGVNIPSIERMRVDLLRRLYISEPNQISWVNDVQNNQNVTDIISYLDLHRDLDGNDTLGAVNFGQEALDALMNNGEVDFVKKIINELSDKEKCVFDKLKNLELYNSTIGEFSEGFYNLTFTNNGVCNGGAGEEACTDPIDLESGNITINMLGMASNKLDYATTLLHEGIHASIYRYVHQFNQGIGANNNQSLFYYYNIYKAQNSNDFSTAIAQHQYMQDNFIIPIAQAIKELDNHRYPLEDYLGFGWEGLKEDYQYDQYIDSNGNVQTMTPSQYNELITKKYDIMSSSSFAQDCN